MSNRSSNSKPLWLSMFLHAKRWWNCIISASKSTTRSPASGRSESRLDDLRQYVGRNLTSRCINLGAGETAILRYRGDDMKVLVEVYNDRGEPVPL